MPPTTTRIALATSEPQLPASDALLLAALRAHGVEVNAERWDDPNVEWTRYTAVVIRSCWNYHLHINAFLDWTTRVAAAGVRLINDGTIVQWNHNKLYLRDLAAAGIPVPQTVFVADDQCVSIADTMLARGWAAAVSKPLISASAYKTSRATSGDCIGPAMLQDYVTSIEQNGEWSLIYLRGAFSHAVLKRPRTGEFRVQPQYGGSQVPGRPPHVAQQLAEQVLALTPCPVTFARVDLVQTPAGFILMELELIEPELFLDTAEGAVERCASAVLAES